MRIAVTTPVILPASTVFNEQSKPFIVFMGQPHALNLAFTGATRTELAKIGTLATPSLTSDNWMHFPEITRQADFILSTWGMPKMDEAFLEAFPRLKANFYAAGTVKGFVTDASYARPVTVCSAATANAIPVAEYTIATVLMSLKRFWTMSREVRRTKTWHRMTDDVPGTYHSTVGIISLGAVGRSVAQMLSRFDLALIAYDPFIPKDMADELGVELVSLEELFRRSDVVSLHSPWIPETENLVNERLLRLMKSGATFINTSRGAIVNEADLCCVLAERQDLTAILDVTYPEPPVDGSPIYQLENIILTPHIAGSMGSEVTRMGDWMIEEMNRYLNQSPLRYQVTREMLARMA